jgi:ribosomal protein S18 acetylase RimI-like enzyme
MHPKGESAVTDERLDANVKMDLCQVHKMRSEDVAGAASLHRLVFPDYFLTHMGQRFMERFYSEFVDQNGNYGFVAVCGEELVGAVIGTLDYQKCFNRFYRRHFPSLVLLLVGRVIVDPYIRHNVVSRLSHIRLAFDSLAARRQRPLPINDAREANPARANLLSIGVHPDQRGSGLAEQLVDSYCDELWHDGIESVGLSVRPDNWRAIAFYEKTGWQRAGASATAVQYTRATRPYSAGRTP